MRIKDIWPTFGDYTPTPKGSWIAGVKKKKTANQLMPGRKALFNHYKRYSHVLTDYIQQQNLTAIAQKLKAKHD